MIHRNHQVHRLVALPILALCAPASAQVLFFADIFSPTAADGSIRRLDVVSTNLTPVLDTGSGIRSVAVDPVGAKVYWCDSDLFKISRGNLDGTSAEDIVTIGLQFPSAIALDPVNRKLYWGDQSAEEIRRCDLDGTNVEFIISTPFHRGLAVDPANAKIYWTTSRTPTVGDVRRANLLGGDDETVLNGGQSLFKPATIALDPQRNRLYFTDYVTKTFRRAALDGAGLVTLYTDQFGLAPRGLAVDPANGDVYWARDTGDEPIQGEILVALGGKANFTPVMSGLGEVLSISILIAAPPTCYPNCDGSTIPPVLNVQDFGCFLNKFAAGDSYANCDSSTIIPVLNIQDFGCFLNRFAAGCS